MISTGKTFSVWYRLIWNGMRWVGRPAFWRRPSPCAAILGGCMCAVCVPAYQRKECAETAKSKDSLRSMPLLLGRLRLRYRRRDVWLDVLRAEQSATRGFPVSLRSSYGGSPQWAVVFPFHHGIALANRRSQLRPFGRDDFASAVMDYSGRLQMAGSLGHAFAALAQPRPVIAIAAQLSPRCKE
jgi:hypothetical protein